MTAKPCQAFEHQGSDLRQALTRLETLLNALPHGVEECDLNGLITYSNPAHHRILGYEPGQLIGQSIWDFELTPEASAALRDHLAHLVRDQPEPTPFFTVNRTADNRKVHLRVDWDYKRDGEGLLLGFTAVITDVSESNRTDALLVRNEARLAESQRLSQIGNWELDIDNGALWWSDEVYRIFELDPAETSPSYDTFLSTVHPDDRELVNQSYNESVSQKTSYELTHRLQFPGGRIKHVIERGETHYDGQGSPVRSVGSVQDITKRVLAKEALQKSESMLAEAQRIAGCGSWELDLTTGRALWSDEEFRLLGYEPGSVAARVEHFLQAVHPDDLEAVQAEMEAATTRPDGGYVIDHRVVHPSGEERIVQQRGRVSFDSESNPRGLIGTTLDITDASRKASELHDRETRFRALFNALSNGVVIYEPTGSGQGFVFRNMNRAAEKMGETTKEQVVGRNVLEVFPELEDMGLLDVLRRVSVTGSPEQVPATLYQDEKIGLWVTSYIFRLPTGEVVAVYEDVSEQKRAEAHLRESEKRFRDLIESLPNIAVRGYDRDRQVIYWNASSERLYGYTREEAEGRRLEDLIIPPGMQGRARKTIARHIRNGTAIPATEMVFQHKDGGDVPVYTSHVLLNGKSDAPEMFCIDVDLQDLKRVEAELSYIASFDSVTDLPNRHHLERELTARLNEAGRFDSKAALIFIDLDNFKLINDSLGHDFGDQVLKCVAEKLSSGIRDYDFLARFGGDEFVLLVPEVNSYEDVSGLTQKLLEMFEKPLALEDHEIFITSSIGVAMYPEDGSNCSQLLKSADTAMYQAKESGKNRYRFFSASMNEDMRRQQALTAGLRRALRDDLFELHYQPQIDLGNGRIVSCEALLRWQDPELGFVSPGEFIPVAEKSDLINQIGLWVIERACRDKAEWNRLGVDQLRVDINISGRQFLFGDVLTALHETLERHRLQPTDIGIELTENALIEADEQTLMKLESYNKQGCKVAVDDFGTGYSSLSYLKQLPVDIIKIDRSFISGLPEDQGDVAILQAIIAMGHSLNLRVLAEGVETEAQETAVTEKACDLAQGYLYHRPMPAENLLEVLNIRADEKRSPG